MDIDFLNYCADYKSKNKKRDTRACFASLINDLESKNKVSIFLYTNQKGIVEKAQNNFCPFNKDEIIFYLNYIKSFVPFEYNVLEHKDEYELEISYDLDQMKRKFLLTSIRYLFEFPFSIYLLDAFKCRKTKKFPFLNFFNLLILIQNTSNFSYPTIHSLGYRSSSCYVHKSKIIKNLDEISEVNLLFNKTLKRYNRLPDTDFGNFEKYDEGFNLRFEYYINNFKTKKK